MTTPTLILLHLLLHSIATLDAFLILSHSTPPWCSHQWMASNDESSHVSSTTTNQPLSVSPSSTLKQEHQEEYYRSVSDYMGGWHAGKFDFDTRISGVTALNYEKSVVFDDGSQTHSKRRNNIRGGAVGKVAELDIDLQTNRPKWSRRKLSWKAESIMDDRNAVDMVVQNEERTWEPFFATIEIASIDIDSVVVTGQVAKESWVVEPSYGTLAPRGGVDLYTDRIEFLLKSLNLSNNNNGISINEQDDVHKQLQSIPSSVNAALYLVVRTEQDHWSWKISE